MGTIAFDTQPSVGADGSLNFALTDGSDGAIALSAIVRDPNGVFEDSEPVHFLIRADGAPVTWLVDETAAAGGNGITWASAFRSPQDALGIALPGDEIWVAEGKYIPTSSGLREASFFLVEGVSLYGGFPQGGGDGTFSARDLALHSSVLSGDLLGDDALSPENDVENSLQVVVALNLSGTTTFDGFEVTGGAPFFNIGGGGLFVENSIMVLNEVIFSGKSRGEFLSIRGSSDVVMTSCLLTGNSDSIAMVFDSGNLEIDGCVFEDNKGRLGRGLG